MHILYQKKINCDQFLSIKSIFILKLVDSEAHYNSKHRHACGTCKKSLPSAHLLDLHIQETHDSYFQLLSGKKPSYECFLEVCKSKYWTPDERREHCIQIHSFPHDFKFDPQPYKTRKKSNDIRQKKAGSASPEAVKRRSKKPTRPRPKSVYAAPMDTTENHKIQNTTPNSPSKIISKLPTVSQQRRLSLSPIKPKVGKVIDPGPVSAPITR